MALDRHTRAALRRELQRAEEEREQLNVVISYLRDRLREAEEAPAATSAAKTPTARKRTQSGGRITTAAAAEKVLSDRNEPMRTPDLLREVQALGAKMKDSTSLFKTLSRHATFRRVGRGLWGLAEWPDARTGEDSLFTGVGRETG